MIIQKIKKNSKEVFDKAEKYYGIISLLNNLSLTPKELQLISFSATRGNELTQEIKREFCEKYKTSSPTINNMISRMKKVKVFVKKQKQVYINPAIVIDFEQEVLLEINLSNETL